MPWKGSIVSRFTIFPRTATIKSLRTSIFGSVGHTEQKKNHNSFPDKCKNIIASMIC